LSGDSRDEVVAPQVVDATVATAVAASADNMNRAESPHSQSEDLTGYYV